MVTVAILIGREGSKGFPGKNTYPLLGRPMMVYPLLAALHTPEIGKLYVSTDSEEIASAAGGFGAKLIRRPANLCTDAALGEEVFQHAYAAIRDCQAAEGETIELAVLLMCNAATILAETLSEGIRVLRENPSLDSAVTVSRYNMWSPLRARRVNGSGTLEAFVPIETFGDPSHLNCDRDSQGDVWFADMGASIVRPICLEDPRRGLLPQRWMGRAIHPLKQWGGLDVDYEWQIPQVEYWLRRQGFTEESTPYERDPGRSVGLLPERQALHAP